MSVGDESWVRQLPGRLESLQRRVALRELVPLLARTLGVEDAANRPIVQVDVPVRDIPASVRTYAEKRGWLRVTANGMRFTLEGLEQTLRFSEDHP